MEPKAELLIIIPAHNEAANIKQVLQKVTDLGIPLDVLVVDDGSRDNTAQLVGDMGFKVISLPYNAGYSAALQLGYKYAVARGFKHVIQLDADGQHDPGDIVRVFEKLRARDCDIVLGSRFLDRGGGRVGLSKLFVINVFRLLIRLFTGQTITDPTSGFQGLNRRVFSFYAGMGNFPEDFPDADTLIHAMLSNYLIAELPVNMRPRTSGRAMHGGWRGLYYFLSMMISIFIVVIRTKMHVRT